MKLTNKVILVTGATKGIGLALVHTMVEKGAKVIASGRDSRALEVLEEQLPHIQTFVLDVNDHKSYADLIANIDTEFGRLDVLINNAAVLFSGDFVTEHFSYEQIDLELRTNVSAPIKLTKALLPLLMRSKEAVIVNITSAVAILPMKSLPIYAATKAALHSFSISLRTSLKESGIRVLEILPPLVATSMTQNLPGNAKNMRMISPKVCADKILQGIERSKTTLRIGMSTKSLYWLARCFPGLALRQLNKM